MINIEENSIYGITLYFGRSIITWNDPNKILPNNDDKMLVITETKKGLRQINIAYYDGQFWHGMGSMSGVIAWAYMPDVYPERHGGFVHPVEKKAGVADGQA